MVWNYKILSKALELRKIAFSTAMKSIVSLYGKGKQTVALHTIRIFGVDSSLNISSITQLRTTTHRQYNAGDKPCIIRN